jgi:hypothetical protein
VVNRLAASRSTPAFAERNEMDELFRSLAGSTIPILGWNVFRNAPEATGYFNPSTWEGWDPEWRPIATNGLGDAIVIAEGRVYEVEHGTGAPAQLSRPIASDTQALENLLKDLEGFVVCSEADSLADLRHKRAHIQRLKKAAPKALKYHFEDALAEVKDLIADARWNETPAGKLQKYVEANHQAWEASIQGRWLVAELMIRRSADDAGIVVCGVAQSDAIPGIVQYLADVSRYPVTSFLKSSPCEHPAG